MNDISKYTSVKTSGWKHEHSTKLFETKEEADYDWAIQEFREHVNECVVYSECFDIDQFIGRIPVYEDLRNALSILGTYQIKYPR